MQVRASIQRALGRPLPLEEIGTMTIGGLKALAAAAGGARTPPPAPTKADPKQHDGDNQENQFQKQEVFKDAAAVAGAERVRVCSSSLSVSYCQECKGMLESKR